MCGHRVRLVACMKAGLPCAQYFGRRAFAKELRLACEHEIRFFGRVLMPCVMQMRRHVDDPSADRIAREGAFIADKAIAAKAIQKILPDVCVFISFAPVGQRGGIHDGIAQGFIGFSEQPGFGLQEIAGGNVKRVDGLGRKIIGEWMKCTQRCMGQMAFSGLTQKPIKCCAFVDQNLLHVRLV